MPLLSACLHQVCRSATSCSADTLVRVQIWRNSSRMLTSLASCGLPLQYGAWALAVLGLFNILGSLGMGWAVGRWRMKSLLSLVYAARAVAESIKTLAWRFASRAEPFDSDDAAASAEFRNRLKAVVEQNQGVAQLLTEHLAESQVTPALAQMRTASLADRLSTYVDSRVRDQLVWYAKKASFNKAMSSRLFALLIGLNIIAVIFALGKIQFPSEPYWPTEIFVTAAACLLAWMQAKRYSELAASYALAAHEINFIRERSAHLTTDKEFSSFVGYAENAFSREHTQWVARQDV